MLIEGKCHCGNVLLELEWPESAPEIPARACGCSFCVKHGGVWTSNPNAALKVAIQSGAKVSKYVFATQTATFHICSRCGVVPFVTSEVNGRSYAVVNVNVLEGIDQSSLRRTPANFEGEDIENRLTRRTRNWIPNVSILEAGA